jgi:hypothetical protein
LKQPRFTLRRVLHALFRGVLRLLAALALLCLIGGVYLSSESGRARLLGAVVRQLNGMLAGRVSVRELTQLRPSSVTLRGLQLRAPQGELLITLESAYARIDWWPLLHGEIVLPELSLTVTQLDLRSLADERNGWASAFASTDGTATEGGDLPNLHIERVQLEAARVSLPSSQAGALELRALTLGASLQGGALPSLELDRAEGQVWLNAAQLGSIGAEGELLVPEQGAGREPQFDCRLRLGDLSAPQLALLLGSPGLPVTDTGSLSASLRVQGTVQQLQAAGTLELAGEALAVTARVRDLEELVVGMQTEGLHLRQLSSALPDWLVASRATLSLARLPQTSTLRAELQATSAVNGVALPDLHVRTDLLELTRLQGLELSLEDGSTQLVVSGEGSVDEASFRARGALELQRVIEIAGALGWSLPAGRGRVELNVELLREPAERVQLRGSLSSGDLQLVGARVERLQAQVSMAYQHKLEALELDATWRAARRANLALTAGRLRVHGGPLRLAFELRGGDLGIGVARASGWLEPRLDRTRLALQSSGNWRGAPWQLDLQPSELLADGRIRCPGLAVAFAGQHATLHGVYSRAQSDIALELAGVDLAKVLHPFAPERTLSGLLSGRVLARGSLEQPALEIELSGTKLGLAPGQALNAELKGTLDTQHLEAQARLQDERGKLLRLDAQVDLTALADASPSALTRLSSGSLGSVLDEAAWQVEIAAEPREAQRWPLPAALADLRTAKVSARLSARHKPRAEPQGRFELELAGVKSPLGSGGCAGQDWNGKSRIDFDAGRIRGEASVSLAQKRLLGLIVAGPFSFLPLLRAQPLTRPTLTVEASAQQVPLAALPVVCQRLHGVLTSTLHLQDPFGTPRAALDVHVDDLSLGSDNTLDFDANLAVDPESAKLHGSVASGGQASTFEAKLPLRWGPGRVSLAGESPLAVSVDLRALPIAPFLPLNGPLSDASGSLSGNVRVSGSGRVPRFSGTVQLEKVAFTVTQLAQPLSNLHGELVLGNGELALRGLSVQDGSGVLGLDGRFLLEPDHAVSGSFDLSAQKFPLRQSGQVVAVTTAKAKIDTNWRPGERNLRIQLKEFDTWLDDRPPPQSLALEAHPDVVVEDSRSAAALPQELAQQAPSAPPSKWAIDIDAGQQFWIRRADFAIKLSALLHIASPQQVASGAKASPTLTGEVKFDRGQLELLGRVFQVERGGTMRFKGGLGTDLNLTARYHDRRSDKMLRVHLHGSATAPRLDFLLDDATITAAEAFTTIYGSNRDQNDDTEDAEAQAGQVVSALTAGALTTGIRRRFGAMAPIVTLEPTDQEGTSEVRAGFELDAFIPDFLRDVVTGVYVEGIVSSERQVESGGDRDVQGGVLIELHFPYNLVTSGRYGPDTTWSVDLGWQP